MHWDTAESPYGIKVYKISLSSVFSFFKVSRLVSPRFSGKSIMVVPNHLFVHVPYYLSHSQLMALYGPRSLWPCPRNLGNMVMKWGAVNCIHIYICRYVYTYIYVERHREDFKSRIVLVWHNLTNSQAYYKAENLFSATHLLYSFSVLFPVRKHKNLAALMSRSKQ